jgi:hypothetical protein
VDAPFLGMRLSPLIVASRVVLSGLADGSVVLVGQTLFRHERRRDAYDPPLNFPAPLLGGFGSRVSASALAGANNTRMASWLRSRIAPLSPNRSTPAT